MGHDLLTISLAQDEGHVTLRLAGEIDLSTASYVREAALDAIRQHGPHLHLDLSQVGFMDSTGLEVLISTRRRAALEGGEVHLVDPSGMVLRVLELSGVARLFDLGDEQPELAGMG